MQSFLSRGTEMVYPVLFTTQRKKKHCYISIIRNYNGTFTGNPLINTYYLPCDCRNPQPSGNCSDYGQHPFHRTIAHSHSVLPSEFRWCIGRRDCRILDVRRPGRRTSQDKQGRPELVRHLALKYTIIHSIK